MLGVGRVGGGPGGAGGGWMGLAIYFSIILDYSVSNEGRD